MAQYDKQLLEQIRQAKAEGLTYCEIQKKFELKSNNLIKIALGKVTGNDAKYRDIYKTIRGDLLEDLENTEERFNALYIICRKWFSYDELELLINNQISKNKERTKNDEKR